MEQKYMKRKMKVTPWKISNKWYSGFKRFIGAQQTTNEQNKTKSKKKKWRLTKHGSKTYEAKDESNAMNDQRQMALGFKRFIGAQQTTNEQLKNQVKENKVKTHKTWSKNIWSKRLKQRHEQSATNGTRCFSGLYAHSRPNEQLKTISKKIKWRLTKHGAKIYEAKD